MKKNVIIAGASRGIGKAIARKFSSMGCRVALLSRNQDQLDELALQLTIMPQDVLPVKTDITSEEDISQAVKKVLAQFKSVDILVCNAGIGYFKDADELSIEEWNDVMDVNVRGTFLITKALIPIFKKQGSGHIIGIASDVSKRTFARGSLYTASKYAQDAFLASVRKEVRKDGIKVSVVYPGLVNTDFHPDQHDPEEVKTWLRPEEVARSVAFIASQPKNVVIDELMIHPMVQDY